MSHLPPPSTPAEQPSPPGPPYPLPAQAPGKALPLVLGAVAGAAGLPLLMVLGVLVSSTVEVFGFVWMAPLVVPLAGLALLVDARTRWWGVGVLIGFFAMLIIGAGACALLVAGLSGSIG